MTTDLLDREMYTEAEAARLLQVSPSTLHYWLEGGESRGRKYQPIIRPEPKGGRADVTWAEFVEAGLLKGYRRDAHVPMRELRAFVEVLRETLEVPYPLAHQRPYVTSGRSLVMEAQRQANLSGDWWLVTDVGGQLALLPTADAFYRHVVWDNELAGGWKVAGERSPVLIDPNVRFGKPNVGGVSTEIIWEHNRAGEADDEIASDFNLTESQVWWALSYEQASRAKRTA